jgi:four helix bundle protein
MSEYQRIEDLVVDQRLCEPHLEICRTVRSWPREERFELTSQVLRASDSAPANLAQRHSDRHVRNRIEGVNRSRGESAEAIHHLYIEHLKKCVPVEVYEAMRARYQECIRMLNGLERFLEQQLPPDQPLWTPKSDGDPAAS